MHSKTYAFNLEFGNFNSELGKSVSTMVYYKLSLLVPSFEFNRVPSSSLRVTSST